MMVGVSRIQTSLKQCKLAIVALALAGVVSTIHATNEVTPPTERKLQSERKRYYWLMSYPYGGADDVLKMVEYRTQESMATHYASEIYDGNYEMKIDRFKPKTVSDIYKTLGPWKNNNDLPFASSRNILVKTYCGGFCLAGERKGGPVGGLVCRKKHYTRGLQEQTKFTDECAKGKRVPGLCTRTMYEKKRRKGYIVVVRNPIDIVLARYKEHVVINPKFRYRTDDLNKWCAWMNEFYADDTTIMEDMQNGYWEQRYFFKEGKTAPPCYHEVYRVIMWYKWAKIIMDREDPSMLVRYEDLSTLKYLRTTSNEILDTFNLTETNTVFGMPFTEPDLTVTFDDEQVMLLKNFIRVTIPEELEEMFAPYYEGHNLTTWRYTAP